MAAAKPKIDLKARLGRKSNPPAGGSSVPPPGAAVAPPQGVGQAGGSVPAPPGMGPSIPPPPGFGVKPIPAPKLSVAPPQVAPQAIKIEMSEEVVAAQKRGRSKVIVLAAICAAVGLGAGFGVGQMAKSAEGAQAAVEGAEALLKEVDESNLQLSKLNDVLKAASDKVKNNQFPAKEVEELGGIDLPFDGGKLVGRGIGRFNASAVTLLMQYAGAVQNAKDQKDKLRRLFGAAKAPLQEAIASKENPKVTWAVAVANGPKGPWAQLMGVTPFEVNKAGDSAYAWPAQLEIGKDKKATRYSKGEPVKPEGPELIPLDPAGAAAMCPETVHFKLLGAINDLSRGIVGVDTQGAEEPGAIGLGESAMDQLRRIGGSR